MRCAARGFAHIGIVRTLIAHGIVPNVVVGTSIGAVVGGAYAAGHLGSVIAQSVARQEAYGSKEGRGKPPAMRLEPD